MATLETSVNHQSNNQLFNFTQGIELDKPLASFEIKTQKAWARGLEKCNLISSTELNSLVQCLDQAEKNISEGTFEWKIEDEDIHMNLERFLCETCGELGKKIHLGRSRNDLIATTLRLFTESICEKFELKISHLVSEILIQAESNDNIIVPGLTHLQFGQPLRISQIYLSYCWALKRDLNKIRQAQAMAKLAMPLGSAALGGTHINIDLKSMANHLGFLNPPQNSYDAVGDRDFILFTLQSLSSLAIHLSRMSEDMIIWSSQPYGWIQLPREWSTGSSIMPNKRNPDVPELIRGKCSQIIGLEQSGNLLLKGLVNSYSSDLHELKRVFLNAIQLTDEIFNVMAPFFKGLTCNVQRIEEHLKHGHILATEVANNLVTNGLPFREAYKQVAQLIQNAEANGQQIHEINQKENDQDPFELAVESRKNNGGTSKSSIRNQIESLRKDFNL